MPVNIMNDLRFGRFFPLVLLVLTSGTIGCRPTPTISTYTEQAYEITDEPAMEPLESTEERIRILGAFIEGPVASDGSQSWFVLKMRGGVNTVGKRVAEFDQFLATIQPPEKDGTLPKWELPATWRTAQKMDQISLFNVRTGNSLTPIDFTFSSVRGSLEDNVNRWEKQVSLPATPAGDLPKVWKQIKMKNGKSIYRLDLTGKTPAKDDMMTPPFAKQ